MDTLELNEVPCNNYIVTTPDSHYTIVSVCKPQENGCRYNVSVRPLMALIIMSTNFLGTVNITGGPEWMSTRCTVLEYMIQTC